MELSRAIRKIGKDRWVFVCAIGIASTLASASGVEFKVEVDRPQISLDESVSLTFSVSSEGGNPSIQGPEFEAPDFEVINHYENSSIKSYQDEDTGQFLMRNHLKITKVLKPLRVGSLKVSQIRIKIGDVDHTAPDVWIQVRSGGAGTPPPQGYGGGGGGLRGAGKHPNAANVFLRAEVGKDKAFKGEQIVVSYYLYRKVRVFNIAVEKFPELKGFLREDLEMPVMGNRLDSERVILDGLSYERSLLARYAAYPLQEGKLKIDPMALKYQFLGGGGRMGMGLGEDDEDPFMNFFRHFNPSPQLGVARSESLSIDVVPVPTEGKPASYTGGVGDFSVSSAVDKYQIRVNEPLTLTVKVEGRGNLAAIGELKARWPENVEFYDSKGHAKAGRGGVGEKVFEYLLIPRVPGKLQLPAMEFSFFDPLKREYVTQSTAPIEIIVSGSASQSASPPALNGGNGQPTDTRSLKPPEPQDPDVLQAIANRVRPVWRSLYLLGGGISLFFLAFIALNHLRARRKRKQSGVEAEVRRRAKIWVVLRVAGQSARAAQGGSSWQEVARAYELLVEAIFDTVDRICSVKARGLTRPELKEVLVNRQGLPLSRWDRFNELLEFTEMIKFASLVGAVSESLARNKLERWVTEGESLVRALEALQSIREGRTPENE